LVTANDVPGPFVPDNLLDEPESLDGAAKTLLCALGDAPGVVGRWLEPVETDRLGAVAFDIGPRRC